MSDPKQVSMFSNLCPRCKEGQVFRHFYSIHQHCPVCDLRFEKEEGYFFGPMIIAYFVTLLFALPVLLVMVFKLEASAFAGMVAAGVVTVVVGPVLYRYAKLVWLHIETRYDEGTKAEHERARKIAESRIGMPGERGPGENGSS